MTGRHGAIKAHPLVPIWDMARVLPKLPWSNSIDSLGLLGTNHSPVSIVYFSVLQVLALEAILSTFYT